MIPFPTRAALAAGAVVAAACGRAEREPPPEPPPAPVAREAPFLPVDSVAALGGAEGLVVLHADRTRDGYAAGHLPGARFLPLEAIVVEREGLPNELPPVAVLDSVFESLGVTDSGRVVLTGEPLAAARAWFTLDYLGHGARASVLDGGLAAWRAGGHPVTREVPPLPAPGGFTPRPRPELVVDQVWVASRLASRRVAVVDARPGDEYRGDKAGDGVPRPGHIPGAGHLFWKATLVAEAEPRLLEADSLRALFAAAGAAPGDTVVVYCRTGVQASHLYAVARALGHVTRMYDGSYVDWSRQRALPVVKGAAPGP